MHDLEYLIKSISFIYNIPWSKSRFTKIDQFSFSFKDNSLPKNSHTHLWIIPLDKFESKNFSDILSSDEKQRLNRFILQEERKLREKSRVLLRLILSCYMRILPQEIEFSYNNNGKPNVQKSVNPICFNLSHSGRYLAVIIDSKYQVGIDIEQNHNSPEVNLRLAKRFFHKQELEKFKCVKTSKQSFVFNQLWTLKEAVLKSMGEGVNNIIQSPNFSEFIQNDGEINVKYFDIDQFNGFSTYTNGLSLAVARYVFLP